MRGDRVIACVIGCWLLAMPPAHAAIRDEIRVYTDAITQPGQFGLEAHFATVPRVRRAGNDPDEPQLAHGFIFTPELSYGLTPAIEVEGGFFYPVATTVDGTALRISPHLRVKWMPRRAQAGAPWFWGFIGEWTRTPWRAASGTLAGASAAPGSSFLSLRPVLGWRDPQWLAALNLTFEVPLGPTTESRSPQIGTALRLVRSVSANLGIGMEYHAELGSVVHPLKGSARAHTLYLTLDFKRPVDLHIGIGHGLNPISGGWSVKGSIEIPFD